MRKNSGGAFGMSISSMYARKAVVYWYVAPMSSNERSLAAIRLKTRRRVNNDPPLWGNVKAE